MWLERILRKPSAKRKAQGGISQWTAKTSWIEDWVKQMVKTDKYFFYKRWLINEDSILFNDPINYILELSRRIVKNLGLPSKNIVASFSGVSTAGKIEHRTGDPYFIEISSNWKDDRTAIAAIIAHEMAHAWMDDQGLRQSDLEINEKLTDLIAILLGLGVLLMNGLGVEKILSQTTTQDYSGDQTTNTQTLKIKNYINEIDMSYALSIFALHKNIESSEIRKKLNSTALLAFNGGYGKFLERQEDIQNSRQVESWIVLCSGCFQKLRLPNHGKNIRLKCPVCSKETKYT